MRKQLLRPRDFFLVCVICLLLGAFLGMTLNPPKQPSVGYAVSMSVPAVDSRGQGVNAKLSVETRKGDGKTLANIDVLLFWVDTQQSIQAARTVAERVSGVDTKNVDIMYEIDAGNISLVGGPSAGAALTIATIASLQGKQPNGNAMITGTIEENASIGAVGGVLEKARAAKAAGATVFLVPKGESVEAVTQLHENCTKEVGYVYCEKTYEKKTVNIGNETGIAVREISTIYEALPFFFT